MNEKSLSDIIDSIDYRFDQIEYEFDTFEVFLENLNTELEYIIDEDFEEEGIPRFFYCPMLLILYAICEAAITEIAGIVQKAEGYDVGMYDMAGGFLKRATRYYEKVQKFKIFTKNEEWKRLEDLQAVRHAIAHANGRLDMVEKETKNKLDKLAKRSTGVDIVSGYVIITEDFLSETVSIIRNAINDLITRVMIKYPKSKRNKAKHA